MDCIFCKIIDGSIPSKKVYEDEAVYAFHDINPLAPVHVLVIPKMHIDSMDKVSADNAEYVKKVFLAIPKIAEELGLKNGYRLISNCGEDGCQSVKHLHFHILGGKKLEEKLVSRFGLKCFVPFHQD
ncbi:MAG: histidine triad nucleotide-binding protein [Clostridia bacterium]|nr:histidine triad nucleotide-binding protein [Clostridia bacterium]